MTREELAFKLAAIKQTLNSRVSIIRIVVRADGSEKRRFYRGSFHDDPETAHRIPNPMPAENGEIP
jgi:hypothetical protein